MTNQQKYENAFLSAFDVDNELLTGLKYQGIQAWDSVGHMGLMAQIEEAFGIMMEPDDIIDFSSFEKGKEILAAKYDVDFSA